LPATNILVVTMFDDTASVLAAVRAGARGYLVKGADRDEVLRAIHTAAAGATTFSPSAARHIANELTEPRRRDGPPGFAGLTGRELQILELMVDGQTNTAIAHRLGLSAKTVRNYTSGVLTKLGADSREDGIAKARAAGIGRQEHP
jgi:DNA-binding NarL/FixJ family response regulator